MCAWGAGNFENDESVGWLHSAIHMPLMEQIRSGAVHADEKSGNRIMAAVEMLALVCEQIRPTFLRTDHVAAWRDAFLQSWEQYADQFSGKGGFKDARREAIVQAFGRLMAVAEWFCAKAAEDKVAGPVELEIASEEFIPPTDRVEIEQRVHVALQQAGMGRVTGGGTFLEPNERGTRSNIFVTVNDLEAGITLLRRVLRAVPVPDATWICMYEPEERYFDVWYDEVNPPLWS